jgi:hypothetical protein
MKTAMKNVKIKNFQDFWVVQVGHFPSRAFVGAYRTYDEAKEAYRNYIQSLNTKT